MHRRAFVAMCAAQVLGVMGLEMGLPFLPALFERVGVHGTAAIVGWTGWAQSVAFGLSLVLTPIWGRIGDATGRRRMLLRAYFGLALSLVALSFAQSAVHVVLARAVQGALAGLTPAAAALLSSERDAGRRIAWLASCSVAGAMIGPLLGGVLMGRISLAGVYELGAALSLAAAALVAAFVAEPRRDSAPVASAVPSGALALPLLAAWITGWRSMEDPLLTIYVQRIAAPSADWALWAGIAVAAARLSGMLAGPWWGARADRGEPSAALRACLFGAGILTAAQALAPTPLALAVIRLALGFFSGALLPMLYAAVARDVPTERRGEAIAFTASGVRVGVCLGGALAGGVVAVLGLGGLFLAMGAGVAGAAPFASRVLRPGSDTPREALQSA